MPNLDALSVNLPVSFPMEESLKPASMNTQMNSVLQTALETVPDSWTPEKPRLTPPSEFHPRVSSGTCSEYSLISVLDSIDAAGKEALKTFALRMDIIRTRIREISADNIAKLKEAATYANNSAWWSVVKKLASCLLSAISLTIGGLVFAGGNAVVGGAMVVSALLVLINFAFTEAGIWDRIAKQLSADNEEYRQKLAMALPIAVGILAGGIGLIGSIQNFTAGAPEFLTKAILIAQTLLALFEGATTLGKGLADSQVLLKQAELMRNQGEMTTEKLGLENVMSAIEEQFVTLKQIKKQASNIMRALTEANHRLVSNII